MTSKLLTVVGKHRYLHPVEFRKLRCSDWTVHRVTVRVSPRSSLDEKVGHGTLNLFAVSRLQLDLLEVNACACTVATFLRRKQHLIIWLWFPFLFYFFFKTMGWASPVCIFMYKSWLALSLRSQWKKSKTSVSSRIATSHQFVSKPNNTLYEWS